MEVHIVYIRSALSDMRSSAIVHALRIPPSCLPLWQSLRSSWKLDMVNWCQPQPCDCGWTSLWDESICSNSTWYAEIFCEARSIGTFLHILPEVFRHPYCLVSYSAWLVSLVVACHKLPVCGCTGCLVMLISPLQYYLGFASCKFFLEGSKSISTDDNWLHASRILTLEMFAWHQSSELINVNRIC